MTQSDNTDGGAGLSPAELIGLSDNATALFDAEGALVAANAAFDAAFRTVPEFLRPGTPWSLFLNEVQRRGLLPDHACHALRIIEERLVDTAGVQPEVEGALTGQGAVRIRLMPTSDQGFAMTMGTTVDPSGLAHSDQDIEQLMAKVLEACPASLTMARIGDGQILYRSPAATELLGKGRNSMDHFAVRNERADFITTLLPDARVDDMRVTGRRADGTDFPASVSARLIDYRGEEVVVSTMDDLTDDIALQQELVRQKDQVFQSEKMSALGELLAGVAHELNNPLSIIVGNAHIMEEEASDDAARRRVGKLSEAAQRCVRIVRTFLSMARDQPLEVAPVPVAVVLDAAIDAYQSGARTADLTVSVDSPQTLPDLMIDEVQITQVLSNLLINADHAIGDTSTSGQVTISARKRERTRQVRITVLDDGPGIPAAIAGRVFDPLFTTKAGSKGTGVGLALCHRIVAAHGGTIALDPNQTTGACFLIDLPMADPQGSDT